MNHGDLTNSSNEKLLPKIVRNCRAITAAANETPAKIAPIMRALICVIASLRKSSMSSWMSRPVPAR